jgi:hypothetical protein
MIPVLESIEVDMNHPTLATFLLRRLSEADARRPAVTGPVAPRPVPPRPVTPSGAIAPKRRAAGR